MRLTTGQNVIVPNVAESGLTQMLAEPVLRELPYAPSGLVRGLVSCTGIDYCHMALIETKELALSTARALERTLIDEGKAFPGGKALVCLVGDLFDIQAPVFDAAGWTIVAEVYTLHLALIGACLLALDAYARQPGHGRLALFFAIYAASLQSVQIRQRAFQQTSHAVELRIAQQRRQCNHADDAFLFWEEIVKQHLLIRTAIMLQRVRSEFCSSLECASQIQLSIVRNSEPGLKRIAATGRVNRLTYAHRRFSQAFAVMKCNAALCS